MVAVLIRLVMNTHLLTSPSIRKQSFKSALHTSQACLSFKVRRANSPEDLEFAFEIARQENWGLAAGDKECYFAADPNGFYIGEINGKKICSLSLIKYPRNRLAIIGLGVTIPEYRNKGYGRKIIQNVIQSIPKDYCIQGDATKNMVAFLQDSIGAMNLGWINLCTIVDSRKVFDRLKTFTNSSSIYLRPIMEIDCEQLCNYEENVTKMYRKSFLSKWINFPGRKGWAALNSDGSIVGFAVTREIFEPKNIHKVAPLYADTPDVAHYLLKQIARDIFSANKFNKMYFDVPISNRHAVQLIKRDLGANIQWEITRLFTKQPPPVCIDNIYAICSNTVG